MSETKNFIWLSEWTDLTANLNLVQLGRLLRAVQKHVAGENVEEIKDKEVAMAFRFIASGITRSKEKYELICQKRADAANKRKSKQMQAIDSNCMQMQAIDSNCNQVNPNPNSNPNSNPNPNPNSKPPYGGINTPAPVGMEFFGVLKNVMMHAAQHRTLVEQFGETATSTAIDELSCKLADGTFDSRNHYATLHYWLSYSRNNGKINQASPTSSMQLTDDEVRDIWNRSSEKDRKEYLDTHEGMTPWQYEQQHGRS